MLAVAVVVPLVIMKFPARPILVGKAGAAMEETRLLQENTVTLNPEPLTLEAVGVEGLDTPILLPTRSMVLLVALASCA